MTCKQLGGACEKEFFANTFEEIAQMSQKHGMEMFEKKEPSHLHAMKEMKERMQSPEMMKEWMQKKKEAFENLPHI